MKKEIFGGPRRTDAKATCAGRAGKRRTDPISTRRFFAKRSAEGSDGAKKKDREIDVGRLVSRDPQGRPNLERRVRPPRSVCPQHVGESAIFQRFKIAPDQRSSSARRASSASFSGVIAARSVTLFVQNTRSFDFSRSPFITFVAIGAQVPFSMKATVRF